MNEMKAVQMITLSLAFEGIYSTLFLFSQLGVFFGSILINCWHSAVAVRNCLYLLYFADHREAEDIQQLGGVSNLLLFRILPG